MEDVTAMSRLRWKWRAIKCTDFDHSVSTPSCDLRCRSRAPSGNWTNFSIDNFQQCVHHWCPCTPDEDGTARPGTNYSLMV